MKGQRMGVLKKHSGPIFGILISAVALYVLFRDVDFDVLAAEFKRFHFIVLPLVILIAYSTMYIRALRWRYLLPSNLVLKTSDLFQAIILGFFATCLLPLRAGEFVRPWFLSRWEDVSFAAAFASVVTERVFDVLAILLLLGFALGHIENPPELVILGSKVLGAIALAILAVMIAAYFVGEQLLRFLERTLLFLFRGRKTRLCEKLLATAEEFLAGLRAISSFGQLLAVIGYSLALWLISSVFYQTCLWLFGEYPSFLVGLTINVMIALAVAAPSAPGFLGTFQAGCAIALVTIFKYSMEFSLAYSLAAHIIQVLIIVGTGAVILNLRGLGLKDMRRRQGAEAARAA